MLSEQKNKIIFLLLNALAICYIYVLGFGRIIFLAGYRLSGGITQIKMSKSPYVHVRLFKNLRNYALICLFKDILPDNVNIRYPARQFKWPDIRANPNLYQNKPLHFNSMCKDFSYYCKEDCMGMVYNIISFLQIKYYIMQ